MDDGLIMTTQNTSRGQTPSTLMHAMQVLQITAAQGERGASVEDYLDGLSLSRPTVYRLLKGLKDQGFLRPAPSRGRYLLGYELLVLGSQAGNGAGLRDLTRPRLLSLAQQFGDSFYLFAPDGTNAVCLEVQNGDYPVGSFVRATGGRIPLGVGQASIAILAHLKPQERESILKRNAERLARDYQISLEAIATEIENSRCIGYAKGVDGSQLPEYTGLAIPILDHSGRPLAAMSCSMLKSRMTTTHQGNVLQGMLDEVRELRQQASGLLYVE